MGLFISCVENDKLFEKNTLLFLLIGCYSVAEFIKTAFQSWSCCFVDSVRLDTYVLTILYMFVKPFALCYM